MIGYDETQGCNNPYNGNKKNNPFKNKKLITHHELDLEGYISVFSKLYKSLDHRADLNISEL